MNRARYAGAMVMVMLMAAALAAEGGSSVYGDIAERLRDAKSAAEMDQVLVQFAEDRTDLLQEVMALLHEAKSPSVKVRACYLLGEIGDDRATPALIENLLLKTEVPVAAKRIERWGPYPCQDAVVKIGKPAEPVLIELLAAGGGEGIVTGGLHVLQRLEGWQGAVFVLEQAWERSDLAKRKALTRALERARRDAGK